MTPQVSFVPRMSSCIELMLHNQALRPLLEPLPTLQQYLCNAFLEKTPMSILSRPTVGLCGRTLVVATSGSKKACMETWEALTSPVSHPSTSFSGGS